LTVRVWIAHLQNIPTAESGVCVAGRVAAALKGWASPGYMSVASPTDDAAVPVWVPAVAPVVGPKQFGSKLNAHHSDNIIQTHRSFAPVIVTEPKPGSWVFDFGQNMAGQSELRVKNCPVGTVISLQHTEILYPSGVVHDSFCERPKYWLCNLRQFANYTCSGAEPVETYRVAFISMGFRYVQMVGYPVRYRPLSHALDVADSAECAGHPDGRLADCSLRP